MSISINEMLEYVKVNDVKFIRLAFCDLFGTEKQISIMPDELERAFENGISFDASAIKGYEDISNSDLFLFPDSSTLSLVPWRPQQGRVAKFLCDIKNPDGSEYMFDARNLLKKAVRRCRDMGYLCLIGAECEFYLFQTNENGDPTTITHDQGGYLDIAPLDKGENVRREICLSLEDMGIKPETSHHEQGPGQNEIDFKYSDALTAADNFLTYKSVIKAIASKNGLYASFMPKPISNKSGSGLHINLSLAKNGLNIFGNEHGEYDHIVKSFIEGILDKTTEISAFLNPTVNSYDRLGSFEAPKYISWSHQNRSQLVRIPAEAGEKTRMELRSPDPAVNPYLAFALILHAGLDGIESGYKLRQPLDLNLYTADKSILKQLSKLPDDMMNALTLTKNSEFVKRVIGKEMLEKYILMKEEEYKEYLAEDKNNFYFERYFRIL
ncbi:glutamine synthetase family protein [Anaerovorax sp. IOR16]|uniref:glutamine synthetase family protein n=1 Tax=Anaerovorax sp. IOR16 TaxID=2773458 RepID=UPI0019D03B1A|nr:glutamine synthetase family protein [Anaerovorax sp. IOR16]